MYKHFASKVYYQNDFDLSFADKENDLLIIDNHFLEQVFANVSDWKFCYPIDAGESLKEWSVAAQHIEKITLFWGSAAHRQSRVIVCGGGSVGDFGGFYASIIKRGVALVHVPTTWLAAIDSSHGGKTALNIRGIKNQLGNFYPAQSVYIFKNILLHLSEDKIVDGFGEWLKMMLIESSNVSLTESDLSLKELLWSTLPQVVNQKYSIVLRDPYETIGDRKILNLGHTFGHILESVTKKSHGLCVLQGIVFSLKWSVHLNFLSVDEYKKIIDFIKSKNISIWSEPAPAIKIPREQLKALLLADKKLVSQNKIDFIFFNTLRPVRIQSVSIEDFISEAHRQGWMT